MVTNNVTVYQFEVGLDEVFADEVRFRVNVDCVTCDFHNLQLHTSTVTFRPSFGIVIQFIERMTPLCCMCS